MGRTIKNYYPSGIYAIHNVTKDIFYIGSSENVETRWKQHQIELKGGYHHNKRLQEDYNNGDYFVYGMIKDTIPDKRQLRTEESFFQHIYAENNIDLYSKEKFFTCGYDKEYHLRELMVNEYCKLVFGVPYNKLYILGSDVKVSMYADIIKNPQQETEIRGEYEELNDCYNKFIHNRSNYRKELRKNRKIS